MNKNTETKTRSLNLDINDLITARKAINSINYWTCTL